jgi:PAS domain S-box-containing protein
MNKVSDLSELIQNLGDFTEDAILITEAEPFDNPGPQIVWCNRAFTLMTGYSLEEIRGKTPRILQGKHPDRRELDRLRAALENWQTCRVELENFHKDGTPFWVEFIVRPIPDPSGFYKYWLSVQRETTDRRKRSALLEKTQRMLAEAPIGLGMLGPDMSITYANGHLENLFYPPTNAPLTPLPLHSWLSRAFEENYQMSPTTANERAQWICESLCVAPYWTEFSLEDRWYQFQRGRLRNEDSLFIVEDVTERHKLRAELDLAMRLESMGQLSGGIAHDFNNLLAVTLGNLEIALEEEDKVARDECITDAIASIISSKEIIQQLLTFARRSPTNQSPLKLGEFCSDFRRIVAVACPDSVELEFSCNAPDVIINVDRAQLETAVLNLVLNALDAMNNKGKMTVTAELSATRKTARRNGTGAQSAAVITVTDTGCGIPSEQIERVIEPFFSTKQALKGTGLGLAMVHGFARQSGGDLKIVSKVGKGTTARLSFPVALSPNATTIESADITTDLPAGIRVLIVDDDPGVRRILRLFLRDLNWSVDEAENGAMAAALLKEGSGYDLLLTDLSMPGDMQGDDLVRYAEQLERSPKCLIITGNPEYGKTSLASLNYTLKPIRRTALLEAIGAVFKTN